MIYYERQSRKKRNSPLPVTSKPKVLKKNKPPFEAEKPRLEDIIKVVEPLPQKPIVIDEILPMLVDAEPVLVESRPVAAIIRQQLRQETAAEEIVAAKAASLPKLELSVPDTLPKELPVLPVVEKVAAPVLEAIEAPISLVDNEVVSAPELPIAAETPIIVAAVEEDLAPDPSPILPAPIEIPIEIIVEPEAPASFETYFQIVPTPETPIRLETIQQNAQKQPPEKSLALFIHYLSELPEDITPEQEPLLKLVQKIELALPACINTLETGESVVHLSPELTEAVIELLQTLGYENPEIVFEQFVAVQGVDFVIEACQKICKNVSRTDTQEFMQTSPFSNFVAVYDTPLQVGKLLLLLLRKTTAVLALP